MPNPRIAVRLNYLPDTSPQELQKLATMPHSPLRYLPALPSEAWSVPLERRASQRRPASFGVLYTSLSGPLMNTADGVWSMCRRKALEYAAELFLHEGEATPVFHLEVTVVWSKGQRFRVRVVRISEEERFYFTKCCRMDGVSARA